MIAAAGVGAGAGLLAAGGVQEAQKATIQGEAELADAFNTGASVLRNPDKKVTIKGRGIVAGAINDYYAYENFHDAQMEFLHPTDNYINSGSLEYGVLLTKEFKALALEIQDFFCDFFDQIFQYNGPALIEIIVKNVRELLENPQVVSDYLEVLIKKIIYDLLMHRKTKSDLLLNLRGGCYENTERYHQEEGETVTIMGGKGKTFYGGDGLIEFDPGANAIKVETLFPDPDKLTMYVCNTFNQMFIDRFTRLIAVSLTTVEGMLRSNEELQKRNLQTVKTIVNLIFDNPSTKNEFIYHLSGGCAVPKVISTYVKGGPKLTSEQSLIQQRRNERNVSQIFKKYTTPRFLGKGMSLSRTRKFTGGAPAFAKIAQQAAKTEGNMAKKEAGKAASKAEMGAKSQMEKDAEDLAAKRKAGVGAQKVPGTKDKASPHEQLSDMMQGQGQAQGRGQGQAPAPAQGRGPSSTTGSTGDQTRKIPFNILFSKVYIEIKKCLCGGLATLFEQATPTIVNDVNAAVDKAIFVKVESNRDFTVKQRINPDYEALIGRCIETMMQDILKNPEPQVRIDIRKNFADGCRKPLTRIPLVGGQNKRRTNKPQHKKRRKTRLTKKQYRRKIGGRDPPKKMEQIRPGEKEAIAWTLDKHEDFMRRSFAGHPDAEKHIAEHMGKERKEAEEKLGPMGNVNYNVIPSQGQAIPTRPNAANNAPQPSTASSNTKTQSRLSSDRATPTPSSKNAWDKTLFAFAKTPPNIDPKRTNKIMGPLRDSFKKCLVEGFTKVITDAPIILINSVIDSIYKNAMDSSDIRDYMSLKIEKLVSEIKSSSSKEIVLRNLDGECREVFTVTT